VIDIVTITESVLKVDGFYQDDNAAAQISRKPDYVWSYMIFKLFLGCNQIGIVRQLQGLLLIKVLTSLDSGNSRL
jgi:uncharacterized protein YutD